MKPLPTEEKGEEGFIFPNKVVTSSIETGQKESKMDGLQEPLVSRLD